MLDYLQRIIKKAGFLDLASTWTAKQTFDADVQINAGHAVTSNSIINANGGVDSGGTFTNAGNATFNGAATFNDNATFAAGKTVTFSGTLVASGVTYPSVRTLHKAIDAIELKTATGSPVLHAGTSSAYWDGSGAYTLVGRVSIPIGATVTGVSVGLSNVTGSPGTIQIKATIQTPSGGLGSQVVYDPSVAIAGGASTYAATPATSYTPVVVGDGAYVYFAVVVNGTMANLNIYGATVTYSLSVNDVSA